MSPSECERFDEERALLDLKALTPEREAAVKAHLASCAACAKKQNVVELVRAHLHAPVELGPEDDVSDDEFDKMVAQAEQRAAKPSPPKPSAPASPKEAPKKPEEPPTGGPPLGVIVILLALLLAGGAAALWWTQRTEQPPPRDHGVTPALTRGLAEPAELAIFMGKVPLDAAQQERVATLVADSRKKFDALGPQPSGAQMEALRDELRLEVRKLLGDEQKRAFDELAQGRHW